MAKGETTMTNTVLRKVLALDAASCLAFFAGCIGFTAPMAAIVGLPDGVIAAAGWICLAAGLLFAGLALAPRPPRALVAFAAAGNVAWVAASLGVAASFAGQMTGVGLAVVLVQAAAVAMLTWLEFDVARSARTVGVN
jgi:hypothetical protein